MSVPIAEMLRPKHQPAERLAPFRQLPRDPLYDISILEQLPLFAEHPMTEEELRLDWDGAFGPYLVRLRLTYDGSRPYFQIGDFRGDPNWLPNYTDVLPEPELTPTAKWFNKRHRQTTVFAEDSDESRKLYPIAKRGMEEWEIWGDRDYVFGEDREKKFQQWQERRRRFLLLGELPASVEALVGLLSPEEQSDLYRLTKAERVFRQIVEKAGDNSPEGWFDWVVRSGWPRPSLTFTRELGLVYHDREYPQHLPLTSAEVFALINRDRSTDTDEFLSKFWTTEHGKSWRIGEELDQLHQIREDAVTVEDLESLPDLLSANYKQTADILISTTESNVVSYESASNYQSAIRRARELAYQAGGQLDVDQLQDLSAAIKTAIEDPDRRKSMF